MSNAHKLPNHSGNEAANRKMRLMRHLFRQWRLVRYVAKRIEDERQPSPARFGIGYRLNAQTVVEDYAVKSRMSPAQATDLLSACIDDQYIGAVAESGTTFVWLSNGAGRKFWPVFSGLILGELGLLGSVWLLLAGIGSSSAVWLVLHIVKVL
jgi:hypothetical protein